MDSVEVKGLRFKGFHGCHAEERKTGGVFETDIVLYTNNTRAADSDQIQDAIDYVEVMDIVDRIMKVPKNLIETVARDIAKAALHAFPQCVKVDVRLKKLSPPVHHELDHVAVFTSLERGANNA